MDTMYRYHEITPERKPEFVARGYKGRYFFPHRVIYVNKPGPEQHQLFHDAWDNDPRVQMYNVLLFGAEDVVSELPQDLFFDPNIMCHQMHLGLPGIVAWAYLYVVGDQLYTDEHQSDLVQHIWMRKELKGKVDARFRSWHYMLLNSVVNFAVQQGLREVLVPTTERLMSRYISRPVNTELFQRLYNDNITKHFSVDRRDDLWVIDVEKNRSNCVVPEPRQRALVTPPRTACVFHDIASGLPGGTAVTTRIIDQMLAIEQDKGVHATYNLAGSLITQRFDAIQEAGHAIGFHSFSHRPYRFAPHPELIETPVMRSLTTVYRRLDYTIRKRLSLPPGAPQTASAIRRDVCNRLRLLLGAKPVMDSNYLCRLAKRYVKGCRPTLHDKASGLNDQRMRHDYFEWLLSDDLPQAVSEPFDDQGLIKVPIAHELEPTASRDQYASWQAQALDRAAAAPFTALGLHAANAAAWLGDYPALLDQLKERAQLRSVQDVVNAYHLSQAI